MDLQPGDLVRTRHTDYEETQPLGIYRVGSVTYNGDAWLVGGQDPDPDGWYYFAREFEAVTVDDLTDDELVELMKKELAGAGG